MTARVTTGSVLVVSGAGVVVVVVSGAEAGVSVVVVVVVVVVDVVVVTASATNEWTDWRATAISTPAAQTHSVTFL